MPLSSGQGPKHSAPPSRIRSLLEPSLQPSNPLGLDSCFCDELYLHPVKGNELLWRWGRTFFL